MDAIEETGLNRPNNQNSERGIETTSMPALHRSRCSCPNNQNSERGIETFRRWMIGAVAKVSEQPEFRAGN